MSQVQGKPGHTETKIKEKINKNDIYYNVHIIYFC